ncbi:indoleamine 2,3-dioxygenase 2 isoform X7 [Choloepus didactylus]|uniref:indoleamine 2,3-dioxygenase 2 isoform X7 n=1 Tax=Choloepus didactylus TaxID=27675 RepID=UPI0018A06D01|nr:indoleamine 2,3-dioxygenase 2 isoform X7 [Choloepus didactylus]
MLPLSLGKFHISEDYGFLLPNPLKELPDHYWPWMEIANNLPHLIENHQLRVQVNKMPLLNCEFLKGYQEQRLAHLILSFITMGYVWQEGETQATQALVQAVNAILQPSQDALLPALQQLRLSIRDMAGDLAQMHDYVDPDIFYAVIRIFLSGWEDNPAMPVGLIYEGVSKEPLKYSGGSAAQSTVLHAFDAFLGIQHGKQSADFLHRMRGYMPPSHKAFIEEICSAPSLKEYVLSSGNCQLLTAYNQCVEALAELRSYHITVVTKYVITAAAKAKSRGSDHLPGPPQALEDRGTGGTAVLSFLKSVRNKTLEAILYQGVN